MSNVGLASLCSNPSLDEKTLLPALHAFNTEFTSASYEGSPSEKKVIFGGLRRAIDTLSEPVQFAALLAIKLITRSRTHLEPLYQPEYVSFLVQFAARTTIDTATRLEALRVILNLFILGREKMTPLWVTNKWYVTIMTFFESLATQPLCRFTTTRILFYLTLEKDISTHMINEQKAFEIICNAILAETDPTDDFKALAARTPDANEQRRLVAQLIKILFNLSMEKDRPSMEEKLPADLYMAVSNRLASLLGQGVTTDDVKTALTWDPIDPAEEALIEAERVVRQQERELAARANADSDDDDDEDGDEEMSWMEMAARARKRREAKAKAKAEAAAKIKALAEEQAAKNAAAAAAGSPATASPAAAATPATTEASPATVTPAAPAPVKREAKIGPIKPPYRSWLELDNDENDPNKTTIFEIKLDICNLLMYMPKGWAPQIGADLRYLTGALQLLHRKCFFSDTASAENAIAPLLLQLTAVIKEDASLAAHCKAVVFRKYSVAPAVKAAVANDGKQQMLPQGSLGDGNFDRDPTSLKHYLLKCVTTMHWTLKSAVSEFLWETCQGDASEYVRLLGFGNAVGLLAEKGLPGFGGLKDGAIDLGSLMRGGAGGAAKKVP